MEETDKEIAIYLSLRAELPEEPLYPEHRVLAKTLDELIDDLRQKRDWLVRSQREGDLSRPDEGQASQAKTTAPRDLVEWLSGR